ncbi:hypothetical protein B0H11DRAFT_1918470 [Mycena galericulata]|nr:hypothetical protein B0H11DRAFT_1918470 [Mycena galericulata]
MCDLCTGGSFTGLDPTLWASGTTLIYTEGAANNDGHGLWLAPRGAGNQQIRHIWPKGTHTPANPTQLQKIRHAQSASLENQRHGTVPNIYIPLLSTPPPSRNRPRFLPLKYACETIPHGGKPAGKRPYGFVATPVKAGQLGKGSPEVRSTAPHPMNVLTLAQRKRLNRAQERGKPALLLDPPSKPPPKTLSEDARMTGSGSDRSFEGAEVEERVFFMFSNVLHGPRLAYIQQGG